MREKVALNETGLRLWGLVVRGPFRKRGDWRHRGQVAGAVAPPRAWKGVGGSAGERHSGPRRATHTGRVWPARRVLTKGKGRRADGIAHGLRPRQGKLRSSARAGSASTMRTPAAPQHGQRVTSFPVSRNRVVSHVSGSTGGGVRASGAAGASTSRTLGRRRLRAELASQP